VGVGKVLITEQNWKWWIQIRICCKTGSGRGCVIRRGVPFCTGRG